MNHRRKEFVPLEERDGKGRYSVHGTIAIAGQEYVISFLNFSQKRFPNRNTRRIYARAIARFLDWAKANDIGLFSLNQEAAASFRKTVNQESSQHRQMASALNAFLEWLAEKNENNPQRRATTHSDSIALVRDSLIES